VSASCRCSQRVARTRARWQAPRSNLAFRHSGARVKRASFDVQLHIRESMVPQGYWEKWIPGLRLTAHPGMTAWVIALLLAMPVTAIRYFSIPPKCR
jgi:hypothetical protein